MTWESSLASLSENEFGGGANPAMLPRTGDPEKRWQRESAAECACVSTLIGRRKDFGNECAGCWYSAPGCFAVDIPPTEDCQEGFDAFVAVPRRPPPTESPR